MDNIISLEEYRKKKNIKSDERANKVCLFDLSNKQSPDCLVKNERATELPIHNNDYINSEQYFKDLSEFMEEQDLYDRFYDYVGQDLYDRIKKGEHISQEELELWGCNSVQNFLDTWRGNSDEEYQKWLIEHGYKTE